MRFLIFGLVVLALLLPANNLFAQGTCMEFSYLLRSQGYTYSPQPLVSGQLYTIRVYDIGTFRSGSFADFAWGQQTPGGAWTRDYNNQVRATIPVPGFEFNPNHIYEWEYTGTGATVGFRFVDAPGQYVDNAGSLKVRICEALNADFEADPIEGNAPLAVTFTNQSTGATSALWNFGDGGSSTEWNPIWVFSVPGIYIVSLEVTDGVQNKTAEQVIVVNGEDGDGGGVRYKPLTTADTGEWGMFDYLYSGSLYEGISENATTPLYSAAENTVFAYATSNSADVHSVGRGTVTAISTPSDGNCAEALNGTGLVGGECVIKIPNEITTSIGSTGDWLFRLSTDTMFVVTVTYDETLAIDYYVTNPQVSIGDVVEPGCIIGTTVRLYNLVGFDFANFQTINAPVDESVTILVPHEDDFLYWRIFPLLILEPDNLTPCNADPNYRACIGDAELRDPTRWTIANTAWSPGVKPIVSPFGYIQSKYNLPAGKQYSMTVNARALAPGGTAQLQIGGTITDFDVGTQMTRLSIPALEHTADDGLLYTVQVFNTGSVPLELQSVCVTEGEPNSAPAACVFTNPSFDDDLTYWAFNSSVTGGLLSGEIRATDGGTISQNIALYPNGSQPWEYSVTIRATVYGSGWESATTSTVGFDWEFPQGGDTGNFTAPNTSTTYPFAYFKTTNPNNLTFFPGNEILFETQVMVTNVTSGQFIITANVDLNDGFVGGVLIREICVNDPLDQWTDTDGGFQPPFSVSCARVNPPQDESLSSWTWFLWANLDRFFQCDLMDRLNAIWRTGYDTLGLVRWQGLYWQSVMVKYNQWISLQLVPWLNGHFRNIALSTGWVSTPETCDNIFCILEALIGVVRDLINLVGTILTQVVNLVIAILAAAVGIFAIFAGVLGSLAQVLTALVDAWNNSDPIMIPGIPNCVADYTGNPVCLALWTLENSVFSGVGAGLIPLLIGFVATNLLLTILAMLRGALVRAGASS